MGIFLTYWVLGPLRTELGCFGGFSKPFHPGKASIAINNYTNTWGRGALPKLGGTVLGVFIIKAFIFWGTYWGSLLMENTVYVCIYVYIYMPSTKVIVTRPEGGKRVLARENRLQY